MAVRKALQPVPGGVDGAAFTDAAHHVLQHPALRAVVQHVPGDDGRNPGGLRAVGEVAQPDRVTRAAAQREGKIGSPFERGAQPVQVGPVILVRQQDGEHAFLMVRDVAPIEHAGPFAAPLLAHGQQAAQAGIGGAVGRVREQRRAALQIQPAADDQPHAKLGGPPMRTQHAGQGIAIGDGDRLVAEQLGGREQFLHVAGAAQEGVVGGDLQLGVARVKGSNCTFPLPPVAKRQDFGRRLDHGLR